MFRNATMIAIPRALARGDTCSFEPAAAGKDSSPRRYQAQWIWAKADSEKPFQFVRFRKTFDLNAG